MSTIYIIKRGAPQLDRALKHPSVIDHPVVVCDRRAVAKWEAGWSGDQSTVWEVEGPGFGMLLVKWQGMDVDYGHLVRGFHLPNGERCGGFYHDHAKEPWTLIHGAIWWSMKRLPEYLEKLGVVYPADEWTRENIERHYDTDYSRRDCRVAKRWDELPDHKLAAWVIAKLEPAVSESNTQAERQP